MRDSVVIIIRSYLKEGNAFVPVESFTGTLPDADYVDGSIELRIGDTTLLTRETWDLVDQLWDYLIQIADKALGGQEASTYFPDQPLAVKLRPTWHGRGIEVEVEQQRASVARDELVRALQQAGATFFERMIDLLPANEAWYRHALARLRALHA